MPNLPTDTKKAEAKSPATAHGSNVTPIKTEKTLEQALEESKNKVESGPDTTEDVQAEKAEKTPAAKTAEPAKAVKSLVGGLGATLSNQTTKVSLLLYGPEGTSKTTSALRMSTMCGPNQRILLIDAEGGAKIEALRQRGVDLTKVEVWPRPEDGGPSALTYEGLDALATELSKSGMCGPDGVYIGGIWDSGTEITRRLLDQVTATARDKDARLGKDRGRFQINLEDHGIASSMLRDLLRQFRDLPWHFVITALERRDTDTDTGKVKYGPAMSPAMANDCAGLVDVVGYTNVEQVGENNVDVYSARFTPLERRRAKDRFGMLPSKMADPFFDRIFGYVDGSITRETDPVQARVRALVAPAAAPANEAAVETEDASKS
jgi:hypothetical protein